MRRDFRQLSLADGLVVTRKTKDNRLDEIAAFIDWKPIEDLLSEIYAQPRGGYAYPVLSYVRLLLLQQWYDLSDEALEAAAEDRLSFRRFCGIPLGEPVPDHSSIWRFREQLTKRGLAKRIFDEINVQLDARGLFVRKGTIIDATIVDAAPKPPGGDVGEVSQRDPQAGWTKKNGKSRFGYKGHVALDEGSELILETIFTSADVHDSQACDALTQGDEAAVYADKAYDDAERRERLKQAGIKPRIMHKAKRNKPLTHWQKALNKAISPIRAAVERRFGTLKRSYGWRRVRYIGLARNATHLDFLATAMNLRRALVLTAA